jgi:lipopolysaccharide export LptBFGC system permease protein LptF
MTIWSKIRSWFSKKPEEKVYKKVIAVRGERKIGLLSVDIGTFNEQDQPIPDAGQSLEIPISTAFRSTANRILTGRDTQDDRDALELLVAQYL